MVLGNAVFAASSKHCFGRGQRMIAEEKHHAARDLQVTPYQCFNPYLSPIRGCPLFPPISAISGRLWCPAHLLVSWKDLGQHQPVTTGC